jgi:beta-aspartyl-peptidase (threonine type)
MTDARMNKITLVIHGGAGNFTEKDLTEKDQQEYHQTLQTALDSGYAVLENGGSSLDAVEVAIKILEDSPLFNAGKGAVLTNEGKAELDASIMDGKTMKAGAVASVTTIKNPISAARKVMDNSTHVFLVGKGAEVFAKEQGLTLVDNSYFITTKSVEMLKRIQEAEKQKSSKKEKHGTVGAVALDKDGNLAAATSTGGMVNKRFGRVGDSPIIGAGTYAANGLCAVSCTGHGEFFIRFTASRDVAALMEYKEYSLEKAAHTVIHGKIGKAGGTGGLIAVDKDGNITMEQNTHSMFRGYKNSAGAKTLIFK